MEEKEGGRDGGRVGEREWMEELERWRAWEREKIRDGRERQTEIDRQTKRQINKERLTDRQIDKQSDTEKQTHRQTGKETDR